jgi:RimK family alpha-L-glutamate ligase
MRLSVLSPQDGWHYRDLCRAAGELIDDGQRDIHVSHFEFGLLAGGLIDQETKFNIDADMIFVRTMPPGSLEQVVFRMDLLQRLVESGTPVVNSPKCVEASVDKYLSLSKLAAVGLRVPDTLVSQSLEQSLLDFEKLGSDVVVKPIFGSMGQGIVRLQNDPTQDFRNRIERGEVIYQQRFIDHGGSDVRLLVIGEQVWGMRRSNSNHWITNISRGGIGSPHPPSAAEIEIARRACQAVGARVAGVDLIYDQNKLPYVLEVNAAVGWKEISRVLQIDVAKIILHHLADLHA